MNEGRREGGGEDKERRRGVRQKGESEEDRREGWRKRGSVGGIFRSVTACV